MESESSNGGRFIAHYNESKKQWEVRVINEDGILSMPAMGPLPCHNYSDCLETIARLENAYNEAP